MTTPDDGDLSETIEQVLATYREHPMDDGDAVLLLPGGGAALEIAGLADHWDEQLCSNTVHALTSTEELRVVLGVARQGGHLSEQDHRIWHDLRQALPEGFALDPLVALPGTRENSWHRRAS